MHDATADKIPVDDYECRFPVYSGSDLDRFRCIGKHSRPKVNR